MNSRKTRILLVEDDKVDQMAFVRFARSKNLHYDYTIVGSIAEAKEILKSTSFDVIISDYMLGDGTGFELFDLFKDLPVIITTGTGNEEIAVEAMKIGACDYLIKDPEGNYLKTLPSTVELSLKRKKTEKKLQDYHERLESLVKERTAELETEIVERKLKEEALRKSEKKYRTLLETTSEGCWLLNHELKTIEVNQSICNMLGYSQDEMLGKTPLIFVDDENRKIFIEQTSKISTTPHRSYEITLKKKNGQDLHTYFNATTIRDESGELQGSFAFITDITERKQAEEELNRLGVAIEQTAESVFITDRDGTIQYVNPAFERLTGYRRKDAIGQNPRILKSGKHDALFYKQIRDNLTRGIAWNGRIINKKKDGSFYEADATISPVFDKSGKITNFVSIRHDVTHEIELEKRLIQAQKMEAIGSLAGGIAHDFNNVIYAIIGYTELSMDAVPEGSKARRNLREVLKAADRAKDMVRQILTFSRKTEKVKKPISVQSVLKEAVNLLRTSLPSTIEIRQDIDVDCGPVMADSTQIHEIIMNLGTNAYHAMREKGGILGITLRQEEIGSDDSKYDPNLHPGTYLKLIVEDTGHGIDANIMGKIFDPYFTTKGVGKGTGMGLSVVHGIVRDHGGNIRVYSKPGKGTAFYVYLPLIETGSVEREREIISAGPVPTGRERILFIDDEEQIVQMVQQILESLGYHVTPRTSSVKAFEAFRAKPDKFDLVITDMTMPNMTGSELATRLLEIRSDIPIILCTGFSELMDEKKANAIGIREYVMKPIIRDKLARTIRKVLDE